MGLDQAVTFPGMLPAFDQVAGLLAGRGMPVPLRMIDGELAFPNEAPPQTWRELRVGLGGGMITLRREADRIVLVVWGNADRTLIQARNALAWAWAAAGGGRVVTPAGPASAEDFAKSADLPAGLVV
jgi:hypothetical protein